MENVQSAESILKQNRESESFNRGYDAAQKWAAENQPAGYRFDAGELRAQAAALAVSGSFLAGWIKYCEEVKAAAEAFDAGNKSYRRQQVKDKLATVLTWMLFAAALALVGLYSWSYYLRQADRAAEEQRLAELAGRVQWLGNVTSYRYWPSDHDPRGNMLVMENRQIEIGLKPDGTVVWRKLPAPALKK